MSHLAESQAQVLGEMSRGRLVHPETGVCHATILVPYAGLVDGEG
jgi:hypothetical protein